MKKIFEILRDVPPFFVFFDLKIGYQYIPSFIFHKVEAEEFELLIQHLKRNNYLTLSIKEYYEYLTDVKKDTRQKVLLTFDDGWRNNWSVVFPILKKYGMKAVFYVNPGLLHEDIGCGPNLEDVWRGKHDFKELINFEKKYPFISWKEAEIMENSGLVNIESHGWNHQMCFVSDKIIDFQHPLDDGTPKYKWLFTAIDVNYDEIIWGAPVYEFASRFIARRYYDDERLRWLCINYVKEKGGVEFFKNKSWRSELKKLVNKYRKEYRLKGRFENDTEQELAIRNDLLSAKEEIEKRLNKKCEHFACPWNICGKLAFLWLKELGFKTIFQYKSSYRIPKVGSNPLKLSRMEGYWIKYLHGEGRKSPFLRILCKI